ncbi:thiamine pyrophosphate-binding protein [Ramlibacter sp. AW1]|uniref:Thiamine pyrophosphate-binding protein n=1 Tax=Ramlibacter aurantiacus TaxID=2801330 RepID=A0A937D789_9BURK|nr:thiamine pyrophosphate-binding protein [Ramlibacter aurantiacus]MBL0420681.1 thiamine pyrophosphate-binding protein [Ramlibacter aurantiacus]
MRDSSDQLATGGSIVAAFLEQCGVKAAFGVISIHNMPILDAVAQRGAIRFVPARGEAGAGNMADAYARSAGTLGVCITSTGPAAGNIAGSMLEALIAGAPVLHITGQIETPYLDKNMSYIHEAPDQLSMLKSISKAAFRVRSIETLLGTLKQAVQAATTAPTGPVSVEIPIDIQSAVTSMPEDLLPVPVQPLAPQPQALDRLAEQLARARRPMLWLGGGARHARAVVQRLQRLGFGVVSSVQGRGIVPEDDAGSIGAYSMHKPIQDLYRTCDAMLVVGSRLRGGETLQFELVLPRPLYRIDIDPATEGRGYESDGFVCGDAALALEQLADRLEGQSYQADASLLTDLRRAHEQAIGGVMEGIGPYRQMVEELQQAVGRNFNWVRDVTLSNSIWGNRQLRVFEPTAAVHAVGGGIGLGMPMAIGAAVAAAAAGSGRKTICLAGDGGFVLNLGELVTAVQEEANLLILLMNDKGYGVIKNIQDANYGGRRCYADLLTPNYQKVCDAIHLSYARVERMADFKASLTKGLAHEGPFLLEIDMLAVGPFPRSFAGPPTNRPIQVPALAAHGRTAV